LSVFIVVVGVGIARRLHLILGHLTGHLGWSIQRLCIHLGRLPTTTMMMMLVRENAIVIQKTTKSTDHPQIVGVVDVDRFEK
jgi:hypothetical protein